jgi:hypothetical protein
MTTESHIQTLEEQIAQKKEEIRLKEEHKSLIQSDIDIQKAILKAMENGLKKAKPGEK